MLFSLVVKASFSSSLVKWMSKLHRAGLFLPVAIFYRCALIKI